MKSRNCLLCQKEFTPTGNRQKFCNIKCKNKWHSQNKFKAIEAVKVIKPVEYGTCEYCKSTFIKIWSGNIYCSRKCGDKVRSKRKAEKWNQYKAEHPKTCVECGVLFNWTDNKQIYCGEKCREKRKNRHKHTPNSKKLKRIKKLKANGEYDNSVTLEALRLRYKDTCAICGKKVNSKDFMRRNGAFIVGVKYPSIDHITPVSKGGTHTWDNVQLAHMDCNLLKNANDSYETATGQIRLSI